MLLAVSLEEVNLKFGSVVLADSGVVVFVFILTKIWLPTVENICNYYTFKK